jgi:hypothetical protein
LRERIDVILSRLNCGALFSQKPVIEFYPESDRCPVCGGRLRIKKTWEKTVVTLDIGAFRAKETVLECPEETVVVTSSALRSLAPKGCTFGFDVIVEVGRSLFVEGLNEEQIAMNLKRRNVLISKREIGYLGRKFVVYLALAHRQSNRQLADFMAKRGGYILHVDGTCEGDSPHLFCGMDGISSLVLDNVKLPSEKKEVLIPFFKRIRKQYGTPVALVHDMGIGIMRAVEAVFGGIPDFICHFHFLRDIGKDLLEADNQMIIKRLKNLKVKALLRRKARYLGKKIECDPGLIAELKTSLDTGELNSNSLHPIPALIAYTTIHWIFDSSHPSRGYGFPFEQPHLQFYCRLQTALRFLDRISPIHLCGRAKDNRPFTQVRHFLEEVLSDQKLAETAADMKEKVKVFDRLRTALRIAEPDGKKGLNDDGDDVDIKTIKQKVSAFKMYLVADEQRKKIYAKMIEQLDKYWNKLFADPITVTASTGQLITVQPQRTNNILERFFRGEKRRSRKKSGTASLNKTLKTILADTPLVRNLDNEEYQRIVRGDCSTLAERFAQIDEKMVQAELKRTQTNEDKIPKTLKAMIKQPDLLSKIANIFFNIGKKDANRLLPT